MLQFSLMQKILEEKSIFISEIKLIIQEHDQVGGQFILKLQGLFKIRKAH